LRAGWTNNYNASHFWAAIHGKPAVRLISRAL
jgi:hypothetical protein